MIESLGVKKNNSWNLKDIKYPYPVRNSWLYKTWREIWCKLIRPWYAR